MDISNEELFTSALSDDPIEIKEATPEAQEEQPSDDRPRDEHGRFVPKPEEQEPKPEAQPKAEARVETKEEAQVPSWRLREIREAREAAERRASDLERQLAQFRQQQQPQQRPDPFENPEGHARSVVAEAVDPIQQHITKLTEFYSQRDAEREYGKEKVQAAYQAIAEGMRTGNPEAVLAYRQAMASPHPYGAIAEWHQKNQIAAEIGNDPQKWFEAQLEKRLADEQFKASLAAKLAPAPSNPKPVFKVPPSLNRASSAAEAFDEGGDLSNDSLFKHALG